MSSAMATRSSSGRSKTSHLSSRALQSEASRPDELRKFKHTAVREMIDLIEHQGPWYRTTRDKVAQIARQVINDLEPYVRSEEIFGQIVADLNVVCALISTERFQVVSSHETLEILQQIKGTLREYDSFYSDGEDESPHSRPTQQSPRRNEPSQLVHASRIRHHHGVPHYAPYNARILNTLPRETWMSMGSHSTLDDGTHRREEAIGSRREGRRRHGSMASATGSGNESD